MIGRERKCSLLLQLEEQLPGYNYAARNSRSCINKLTAAVTAASTAAATAAAGGTDAVTLLAGLSCGFPLGVC